MQIGFVKADSFDLLSGESIYKALISRRIQFRFVFVLNSDVINQLHV